MKEILKGIKKSETFSFSFEAHPANTTFGHLYKLKELGFDRLSLGIQDFDLTVQKAINRIQTFEQVEKTVVEARSLGFKSINFDIIYGLPFQTEEAVKTTVDYVNRLMPERIAFYSYAHVPWKHKAQRRYTEADLPSNEVKRKLYEVGRMKLEEAGYKAIGMDHFALESDDLYQSFNAGKMHRNFMGYTPNRSDVLIGLGVSSISDIGLAMMQNKKLVEDYNQDILNDQLSIEKGHVLTEEDLVIREHVLDLMCHNHTRIDSNFPIDIEQLTERMQNLIEDELVELNSKEVKVTSKGETFVRNVALCIDQRYWNNVRESQTFSKSI